jgi:hypothetical protein
MLVMKPWNLQLFVVCLLFVCCRIEISWLIWIIIWWLTRTKMDTITGYSHLALPQATSRFCRFFCFALHPGVVSSNFTNTLRTLLNDAWGRLGPECRPCRW